MKHIESIGENIRILRVRKGLSQEQLALNARINTSYIGQIERGEKNPTIKILERISSALDITLLDLLSEYDEKGIGLSIKNGHNQPLTILSPDEIKQFILEVLRDNTNMVIDHSCYFVIISTLDYYKVTASYLIKHCVSLKEIQVWLGYSTISITANTYTHIDMETKKDTVQKISDLFAKKEKDVAQ